MREAGKLSVHVNAEPETVELLFRTVHAANQLSIYGAVAYWCSSQKDQATESSAERQSEVGFP